MAISTIDSSGLGQTGTNLATTSGNVGIGTASPITKLHTLVSSGNTIAKFENTISTPGYLGEIILAAPNRPAVRFNFQTSNDSNGFFNYDTGIFKVFNNVGGSATQSLEIDTSANLKFNSGYGSVATAYGCRAWVNFNGQGTIAIRASGNVSSLTDNGVGLYVVNLTNALPDTNGAVLNGGCFSNAQSTSEVSALLTNISTTSAVQISAFNTTTGGRHDATYVMVGVQR